MSRESPAAAPPPIARATLTVATLGVLLAAQGVAVARLDFGPDGLFSPATRSRPITPLIHPLASVTAGWLVLASIAWAVLGAARRRAPWEAIAAALGVTCWPTALAAAALLATTLAAGPATPFVALFWASVAVSAGVFARALARLPSVGSRGAAAVIAAVGVPLAIAALWVVRPWLVLHRELASLGIPS